MNQNSNNEEGSRAGLQFISYNVRGLRDCKKRDRVFNYIKTNRTGVTFLQETYTLPGDLQEWQKVWGKHVYLSHGTSHSRGVAVIIPDCLSCEIKRVEIDNEGRYICMECCIEGQELALINFYAPTGDKCTEQLETLEKIEPYINELSYKLIWGGGDLNLHLSPTLDKYGKDESMTKYAKKVKNILEEHNLCDIWRLLNPHKKRYTWRKITSKGVLQSRLDYFFIPLSKIYDIQKMLLKTKLEVQRLVTQVTEQK